jgi:hypothetical protein
MLTFVHSTNQNKQKETMSTINTDAIQRLQALPDNADLLVGVPGKSIPYKVSKAVAAAAPVPAYLTYSATLFQVSAVDPTAFVLENTLGSEVVWTRDGAGNFLGTLADPAAVNGGVGLPDTLSGLWFASPSNQSEQRTYIMYENDNESFGMYDVGSADGNMTVSIEVRIPNPAA